MNNQINLWWIPFITACVFAVILFVSQKLSRERASRSISAYRRQYLHFINRLEKVTLVLNRMVSAFGDVKSDGFWQKYEQLLQRFERVLAMARQIAPFGTTVAVISSAHELMDALDLQVNELLDAMSKNGRDLPKNLGASHLPIGCYFCSRPFVFTGLVKVKAKIEGQMLKVSSCQQCHRDLGRSQKIKILYFIKDGVPKHWSEVSEYNPATDFATLGSAPIQKQTRRLEIIKSIDE